MFVDQTKYKNIEINVIQLKITYTNTFTYLTNLWFKTHVKHSKEKIKRLELFIIYYIYRSASSKTRYVIRSSFKAPSSIKSNNNAVNKQKEIQIL